MNPNSQVGGRLAGAQAAQMFTKQHNDVYEKLRGVLMGLHGQGVPGIDNVLKALNNEHVTQTKNMVPGALGTPGGVPAAAANGMRRIMTDHTSMQGQSPQGLPSAMMGGATQITPEMIHALQAMRSGTMNSAQPSFSGGQVPGGMATY